MYNMRPSLFCGGVKGNLELRWSLHVPTANCYVYERRRVRGGWGKRD